MRPTEFKADEIIEAGKRIQAEDKRVTGYALRRILGGGDQKRLFTVWQSHFTQQTEEHKAAPDLPLELEESLSELTKTFSNQIRSLGTKLHEVAVKSAGRQVSEVTREYKELEEQTEAELKDAAKIIEELEGKNVELKHNLGVATRARDTALAKAEKDREKLISIEARLTEMAGIEEVMKRLKALEDRSKQS